MGELKIVCATNFSCFNWKEVKQLEQSIKNGKLDPYKDGINTYQYKIPIKAKMEIFLFANSNFIKVNGKHIKDVFSL
jgi:hypothetical protein